MRIYNGFLFPLPNIVLAYWQERTSNCANATIRYSPSLAINRNMSEATTKRVLLVDDEPNIIVALEFLMKQQGYQVDTAYNGQDALQKMEAHIPNVVVLDVMMQGMDGFEVAQQIRRNPALEDTRIVFLTAKGTKEDRMEGYTKGGEVYLTKPFDNDELVSVIGNLMEFG
jgi:DNA-binding response OmpR family regulator